MTKKDVIKALDGLDDDAEVSVFVTSLDADGGRYADDVYFDDKNGVDEPNSITLVAHF